MKIYDFMKSKNQNQIKTVEESVSNVLGLEPLPTATKEVIQSIYRFNVGAEDSSIINNPEKLSERMIDRFINSDCYKSKSEEEKNQIIQFLKDNPEPENPLIDN